MSRHRKHDPTRSPGRSPGTGPPRWSRRLLRRLLPSADRDELIAELDVLYATRVRRRGRGAARRWYVRQLFSFAVHLAFDGLRRRRRGSGGASRAGILPLLGSLAADVQLGLRRLADRPGTTLAMVVTLGVGVAGAATTYLLTDWVLLRPVPGISEPDRLLTARLETRQAIGPHWRISHPDLERLTGLLPSLNGLAATAEQEVHLAIGREPVRVPGELVTANYFDVLGVVPVAGRAFTPDEGGDADAAPVIVVSHRLWQRHWARDPGAVGSGVRINGVRHTVVGVAPPGFHGAELPGRTEVWLPAGDHAVVVRAGTDLLERPTGRVWERLIGRRRDATPVARVREELDGAMQEIRRRHTRHSFIPTHFLFRVYPGTGLAPSLRQSVPRTLGIVGTASALLLLLTCVNVTSLGLARAAARRSSTAVCRALGAGRGRLLRERLVEGLLVGVAAALVGAGVTAALGPLLRDASVSRLGVSLEGMGLGARGLAVTTLGGLAAGGLAGLWPALRGARADVMLALRSADHGDRDAMRSRSTLVVVQVALSVVLLLGAGLLARTLWNLRSVDLGVPVDEILTFQVDPAIQGYDGPRTLLLLEGLARALESDPTVVDAGAVFTEPLSGRYLAAPFVRFGGDWETQGVSGHEFQVTPSWLRAAGLELVAGRHFRPAEWRSGPDAGAGGATEGDAVPGVAILSETFARGLFPDATPVEVVGRNIGTPDGRRTMTVVGVVRDARLEGVASEPGAVAFRPWAQGSVVPEEITFWVRTRGGPLAAAGAVRQLVREADPLLPVYSLGTLTARIDRHLSEQRFVARVGVLLATLGLLLGAVGLYSVLSHAVVERTREIGIRAALGAGPGDLLALIVRSGMRLAALGAAIGLLVSPWLVRPLESRLYRLESLDPTTYAGGLAILLVVALAASVLPAVRAVRVDPVRSLRGD